VPAAGLRIEINSADFRRQIGIGNRSHG
jgi:hypothetical protein